MPRVAHAAALCQGNTPDRSAVMAPGKNPEGGFFVVLW
jgi:hypothetical protein